MNIRDRVKLLLKMCGHAFVSTVHERFDRVEPQLGDMRHDVAQRFYGVEQRISELRAQNIELAESQNAILESALKLVENLQETQKAVAEHGERFQAMEGAQQCAEQAVQQISTRVQQTYDATVNLRAYTKSVFDDELVRQVCVETSDYGFTNPETGLMSFLYSYLPTRKAVDVGAHVGNVSEALLETGYELYAFEPYAPVYEKLVERLGKDERFHPFPYALGCAEGNLPLHLAKVVTEDHLWGDATVFNSLISHSMPESLPFAGTAMVTVTSLANLHKSKVIPEDISLVKIDTEGYDLEVIRGMGDYRYPVVMTEFWDSKIPFGRSGLLYTPQSMVEEMRQRGYHWYIVLYRVWGRNQTAFYCNHPRSVPDTWGNTVFFQEYELFSQGQAWCAAVLPRTYFKPVAVA
jgi:FkbM family methyltransferase